MNRDGFEARVLDLWVTTRVPLTRANLQYATGASRKQVERWLDSLAAEGVIDLDPDDAGEMVYSVRGAHRPANGATSIAEVQKLASLKGEVKRASRALAITAGALKGQSGALVPRSEEKSILASTALSFFFGPLGWIYAAPLREAVPAVVLFVLLYKILPMVLFAPLLGVLLPASAIAGAAYAWAHNQSGGRAAIGEAARGLTKGDRK